MSGYFSSFSLNKITDSIANAAHKTQDTLSSAIANVNINDPQTKLSLKAHTRYLQETLGTIDEISKLPPQYQSLEKKSDALEKCCKRMLLVTKTFEVEGYDYPPNLTESISDWWSLNKDGWFGSKKAEKESVSKAKDGSSDAFLPRSFSQAISKAANDCGNVFTNLQEVEKKEGNDQDDDEEEDEDVANIVKMFDSWSTCYKNIDEGKQEMDNMIVKEFNKKLEKIINEDFKKVHSSRKKVEDSRLKFDTVRYEIKLKEAQKEKKAAIDSSEITKKVSPAEKENDETNENDDVSVEGLPPKNESAKSETTKEPSIKEPSVEESSPKGSAELAAPPVEKSQNTPEANDLNDEDNKLLEELEDEFVSNTTSAVEIMGEVTESSEILGLAKLFQNFQLVYFRQCVQEIEASLKTLSELDGEEN